MSLVPLSSCIAGFHHPERFPIIQPEDARALAQAAFAATGGKSLHWRATADRQEAARVIRDEHGESLGVRHAFTRLLKLGFEVRVGVASTWSTAGPPSQGWRTFLRNHDAGHRAIGTCRCVPTIWFRPALCLRHCRLDRRTRLDQRTAKSDGRWLHSVTSVPWDEVRTTHPRSDRIYGSVVARRLRPWDPGQAYRTVALAERLAERLMGSIRRECVDHIILGRDAFASVLKSYATIIIASERIDP